MNFQAARRVDNLAESAIFRIKAKADALAAQGRDIIHLDAGEPDFDTPGWIIDAAKKALDEGYTHYTPIGGLAGLKQAIAHKLRRDNNLYYDDDEILQTCGAKQALFNACMTLLQPGDEIVIPSPHWGTYVSIATIARAAIVEAPTVRGDGFILTPETLESCIGDKTRAVILNSPNNPTGQIYDRKALSALGNVLLKYPDVFVISDDIYEHLRFTGEPFANIVNVCPSLKDRTIVVNGVSKAYAMTGWRVGFAAGPASVIGEMQKFQGQTTSHTAAVSQKAAEAAFNGGLNDVRAMKRMFRERAQQVEAAFADIETIDALPIQGGFYSLPDFSRALESLPGVGDDEQLGEWLLDELGLAMVPGSAFAAPGHMRLSFATDSQQLSKALKRLSQAFRG